MELNDDAILACMDLAGRCGASGFNIGHLGDDDNGPVEDAEWYAEATFRGARITAGTHASPDLAAMALAHRLLRGAVCRCGRSATLQDQVEGKEEERCRWRLVGRSWEPGCDAPSVRVPAERGDHAAIVRAMENRMRQGDGKG